MKLTKLRLLGFKSFVEPTDFLIEPGLTGVVGPNGCGKSNLVEALRWVMGETSHKSMRAADMDDVIFSGNTGRPQRNTAEVAMAIDNSDRSAPSQFNGDESLEVSRRIEREKGSTYRVNGREVRARDVHILFADASTGARSPALVHQGRGVRARRGVGEQQLHVARADLAAVDPVGRALAAVDPPDHLQHRMIAQRHRRAAIGVVDRKRDLGVVAARASAGPGEDHVVHAGPAHRLG